MSLEATLIDVRTIAPRERHAAIFATYQALPAGGGFEIVNDHDPLTLYMQFQNEWPGQFGWQYLEAGPQQWRVRISRKAAGKSCCGCCGG